MATCVNEEDVQAYAEIEHKALAPKPFFTFFVPSVLLTTLIALTEFFHPVMNIVFLVFSGVMSVILGKMLQVHLVTGRWPFFKIFYYSLESKKQALLLDMIGHSQLLVNYKRKELEQTEPAPVNASEEFMMLAVVEGQLESTYSSAKMRLDQLDASIEKLTRFEHVDDLIGTVCSSLKERKTALESEIQEQKRSIDLLQAYRGYLSEKAEAYEAAKTISEAYGLIEDVDRLIEKMRASREQAVDVLSGIKAQQELGHFRIPVLEASITKEITHRFRIQCHSCGTAQGCMVPDRDQQLLTYLREIQEVGGYCTYRAESDSILKRLKLTKCCGSFNSFSVRLQDQKTEEVITQNPAEAPM